MQQRNLTQIQGGHSDNEAEPWLGSVIKEDRAEQMGSKPAFCGCACCYCCLFSSYSGSNHFYRLDQINETFVISVILVK